MDYLEVALSGGLDIAKTEALLGAELVRLDLLQVLPLVLKRELDVRAAKAATAPAADPADPVPSLAELEGALKQIGWTGEGPAAPMDSAALSAEMRRFYGVAVALSAVGRFVADERPRIKEVFALRNKKRRFFQESLAYVRQYPDGTDLGRHAQHIQEILFKRLSAVCDGYPTASYVAMGRRGPPKALLVRHVAAALHLAGYSWPEIAKLVDDGKPSKGRARRLWLLLDEPPFKEMRASGRRPQDSEV